MKIKYNPYSITDTISRLDSIINEKVPVERCIHNMPVEDERSKIMMSLMHASVMAVNIKKSFQNEDGIFKLKVDRVVKTEICNIMCDYANCIDIVLHNERVIGIYNTPFKTDVDYALDTAAKICTLAPLLNKLFKTLDVECEISLTVGLCYGEIGYSQISVSDEKVVNWTGKIINDAINYSEVSETPPVRICPSVFCNLKKAYQDLFQKNEEHSFYQASLVNIKMNEWINSK